jgi:hypothetical protein
LAGNSGGTTPAITYSEYPYGHAGQFYDVTSGSNGRCYSKRTAKLKLLCTAVAGYDGPTGLGSPHGLLGF